MHSANSAPLYFGSGAHNEKNLQNASPVLTDAGKKQFVKDVEQMLSRLGDIAIPHTVYQLIRVLDFLLAGDAALCFDLFAHALTLSGQKHGFQGESLGVDVLVRFVSRCLADYDYIFKDAARRDKLVASGRVTGFLEGHRRPCLECESVAPVRWDVSTRYGRT